MNSGNVGSTADVVDSADSGAEGLGGVGDFDPGSTPADRAGSVSEPHSKLTIVGEGLRFEREIPDTLVLRIIRLVLTGDFGAPGGEFEASQISAGAPSGRTESLAEFYRRADPKKYPEKLTTIGAYLQHVAGRRSFTAEDLRSQFRAVNEPPPANMPRDLRVAIGNGWIAEEHDQPGEFFVTRSGLENVNDSFSANGSKKTRRSRRRRRSSAVAAPEATSTD